MSEPTRRCIDCGQGIYPGYEEDESLDLCRDCQRHQQELEAKSWLGDGDE